MTFDSEQWLLSWGLRQSWHVSINVSGGRAGLKRRHGVVSHFEGTVAGCGFCQGAVTIPQSDAYSLERTISGIQTNPNDMRSLKCKEHAWKAQLWFLLFSRWFSYPSVVVDRLCHWNAQAGFDNWHLVSWRLGNLKFMPTFDVSFCARVSWGVS